MVLDGGNDTNSIDAAPLVRNVFLQIVDATGRLIVVINLAIGYSDVFTQSPDVTFAVKVDNEHVALGRQIKDGLLAKERVCTAKRCSAL